MADSPPRPREPLESPAFPAVAWIIPELSGRRAASTPASACSGRWLARPPWLIGLGALATFLIVSRLEGAAGRLEAKVEKFQVRDRNEPRHLASLRSEDLDDLALFLNDPPHSNDCRESKKNLCRGG